MIENKLGKIDYVHYGNCGYQDAMIGLKLSISGDGWGVGADMPGGWTMKRSEHTNWSEEDRLIGLGKNAMEISKLLKDAKVESVDQLKGKPVECVFDGMMMQSWRILKEVIL